MPLLETLTLATLLWSAPTAWASAPGRSFAPPSSARWAAPTAASGLSAEALGRRRPWRRLRDYHARPGRGGNLQLDLGAAPALRTGPALSWLSPDPPREGWLKTRVVAPGWGVWYAPAATPLSIGLSTSTRFLITDQSPTIVDPFVSQAHVSLALP